MPISGEPCITTLHPQGKNGVHIRLARYEQTKQAIMQVLATQPELTFDELTRQATAILKAQNFDGNPPWYIVSVKLDLEARGVIKRLNTGSPQRVAWVGETAS